MSVDLSGLQAAVAAHGRVVRVVIAEKAGSAPRDAGAAMLVWAEGQSGSIGGGALEYQAVSNARQVLRGERPAGLSKHPLGPALGQCCGGSVSLLSEVIDAEALERIAAAGALWCRPAGGPAAPSLALKRCRLSVERGAPARARLIDGWMIEAVRPTPNLLWVHGAGHVGRAVVSVMTPLPDWEITWVDTTVERFPESPVDGVDVLVAADPARAAAHAPEGVHHLILTYSHALDLALCDALLRRGFASAGLIGSETKWARFTKRLREAGHAPKEVARIACPIGDRTLGRHPQALAIGVAARLIREAAGLSHAATQQESQA